MRKLAIVFVLATAFCPEATYLSFFELLPEEVAILPDEAGFYNA